MNLFIHTCSLITSYNDKNRSVIFSDVEQRQHTRRRIKQREQELDFEHVPHCSMQSVVATIRDIDL